MDASPGREACLPLSPFADVVIVFSSAHRPFWYAAIVGHQRRFCLILQGPNILHISEKLLRAQTREADISAERLRSVMCDL